MSAAETEPETDGVTMCGGSAPKPVKRDLQAEQLLAERTATKEANAELAAKRTRRRNSSLIANPGGAAGLTGSAISQPVGKDTLG